MTPNTLFILSLSFSPQGNITEDPWLENKKIYNGSFVPGAINPINKLYRSALNVCCTDVVLVVLQLLQCGEMYLCNGMFLLHLLRLEVILQPQPGNNVWKLKQSLSHHYSARPFSRYLITLCTLLRWNNSSVWPQLPPTVKISLAVSRETRIWPNFIMNNSSRPPSDSQRLFVWWVHSFDYMFVVSFVTVSSSLSLVQFVLRWKPRGKNARCLWKINKLHGAQSIFSRTRSVKCLWESVWAFAQTHNPFSWYISKIDIP